MHRDGLACQLLLEGGTQPSQAACQLRPSRACAHGACQPICCIALLFVVQVLSLLKTFPRHHQARCTVPLPAELAWLPSSSSSCRPFSMRPLASPPASSTWLIPNHAAPAVPAIRAWPCRPTALSRLQAMDMQGHVPWTCGPSVAALNQWPLVLLPL